VTLQLLRLRLIMARLKALGLRPEGSNGADRDFDNLSINKRIDVATPSKKTADGFLKGTQESRNSKSVFLLPS